MHEGNLVSKEVKGPWMYQYFAALLTHVNHTFRDMSINHEIKNKILNLYWAEIILCTYPFYSTFITSIKRFVWAFKDCFIHCLFIHILRHYFVLLFWYIKEQHYTGITNYSLQQCHKFLILTKDTYRAFKIGKCTVSYLKKRHKRCLNACLWNGSSSL